LPACSQAPLVATPVSKKKMTSQKKKKAKSQQPYPHHIQQTSPKKGIPAKVKIPVNILHQNRWTERPQNRPSSDALKKFPFDPSTPRKPRKTKKNQEKPRKTKHRK